MQNTWLGSAWLALGLDALAVWTKPRIWPLDFEAPDYEAQDHEADPPSPRDPLDITIFI